MNKNDQLGVVAVSLMGLLAAAGAPAEAWACDERCSETRPVVTHREAKASLGALLRASGLAEPASAEVVVRNYDLDGDSATTEALVDVIAVELCVGGCPTIVVRKGEGGLVALGHGTFLIPAASRSCGWLDLVETVLPFLPARVLRFSSGRYQ